MAYLGVHGRVQTPLGTSGRIRAYLGVLDIWAYLGVSGRIWRIWAYLSVSGRCSHYLQQIGGGGLFSFGFYTLLANTFKSFFGGNQCFSKLDVKLTTTDDTKNRVGAFVIQNL